METPKQTDFHTPVLLEKVISYLNVRPGRKYIDATIGGGGHSSAILNKGGIVLGIDMDPESVNHVRQLLAAKSQTPISKCQIIKGNFRNLGEIARRHHFTQVDGILFDLGMSTWQIKHSNRGFTFMKDEPLDMRMDPSLTVTAADLVNGLTEKELTKLFKTYGNDPNAQRIAHNIVCARQLKAIKTTRQLAEIVKRSKRQTEKKKIHPATLAFQALRIAVNNEINNLKTALEQTISLLNPKGRIVVISFHSLEDKTAKHFFKQETKRGNLKILTKKPVQPSMQEITDNPSARSARLRAAEKINHAAET
ncbi:16S rRNA (cytosine(1402)-N(4))-methyltransferase [candidate division CPR3 bacterium 4484_211]|uniref:Ribosomal RNA small subunit methyltransferase H n=1 Tax=candidate division CPR3 bacterium 4484_211 TaxID=1968527 RepID=A0A1W9NZI1_UNCC3|nr:MAG: 16S rRNA (cytosine(1402)-N(4))-methyltransferase [candidate division CPR3 bacterium 4484_211]